MSTLGYSRDASAHELDALTINDLRATLAVLQKRGWCQHHAADSAGRVSLRMAVVLGVEANGERTTRSAAARRYNVNTAILSAAHTTVSIDRFNDDMRTTYRIVVRAIVDAITALRGRV